MAKLLQLNLIDTPGHVDFSYEVSAHWLPAKARCWWRTSQGVERPTPISPSITAWKLFRSSTNSRPAQRGCGAHQGNDRRRGRSRCSDAVLISAKTGQGVPDVLKPSSSARCQGNPENRLQALIFDSWFDPYRGVIVLTLRGRRNYCRARKSASCGMGACKWKRLAFLPPSRWRSRSCGPARSDS